MTARTDARKYYPGIALMAEVHWLDTEDLEFGDAADVTLAWDGTNLNILPRLNDTGQIRIGNGTLDMDFRVTLGGAAAYVQFDVGNVRVDFEGVDLRVMDGDFLQFGDDADVGISWDGNSLNILPLTDNVGVIEIGNGTLDIDLQIFMGTAAQSVLFDNNIARVIFEGTDLRLMDADILEFGDDADVAITWDGGSLNIVPLTDNVGVIEIGNGTNDIDVQIFMNAAGQHVLFDVDVSRVIFTGTDLRLMDNDILEFGDEADVSMTWDTNSLNILPRTDNTGAIEIGDGTTDIDLKVFLGETDQFVLFDVDAVQVEIAKVGIVFTGALPSHAIDFTGMTLDTDMNLIRGTSLSPTRTSGWIALQGSIDGAPNVCYPLYLQLATTGVATILGIASFMEMSAGASCQTLWGAQFAAFVANGATVLSAAAAPTIGVFSLFAKTTLDNCTFNAGGVAAAIMVSLQVNVIDVTAEIVSLFNCEIVGRISSAFYIKATGGAAGAIYMFDIPDNIGEPAQSGSGSVANVGTSGWIKVRIGGLDRYIPLGDGAA